MMRLQTFARNMRTLPTDAEATMWRQLRAHRFAGHKFKRQQPLGNYIVDFVCFEAGVIVEVDGGQHNESGADAVRDAWLLSRGYRVLRFWNNDVLGNLDGVLTRILEALAPSPSVPLLRFKCALVPQGEREDKRALAGTTAGPNASLPPRGGGTEGEGA